MSNVSSSKARRRRLTFAFSHLFFSISQGTDAAAPAARSARVSKTTSALFNPRSRVVGVLDR
jgi:hypothetical protein|tara:strand:- start:1341 stop:1526 length:186 start_codon:yes stop_codon:yes gene_type:complete